MTRTSRQRRLLRRSAALAGVLTFCAVGTAHADIAGVVTNAAGVPVPGASINVTEANGGGFASFDTTDANGAYLIQTSGLSGDTPPFIVTATFTDSCKDFATAQLSSASGPLNDGATQNFTLDAASFCGDPFPSSSLPDPTGNAWPERGEVLSPPGGVTYLRVLAPSDPSSFALTLAGGTPVGGGTDRTELTLTAPATAYNGPLFLSYTSNGVAVNRQIGTLISGPVPKPNPPKGASDLAAIVDVSGSMAGNDPTNRRLDAVNLLIDLAGQGDRLEATGFDDGVRPIFPRTTIAGNATKVALKKAAKKAIGNFGGTDYNVGLADAFNALAADPLNPTVPKSAIFLTDGANGGTYDNSHLRFAFNGTGTAWPICVVQLGKSGFTAADTARLKRIAAETGGTFAKSPTNAELQNIYFACRGRSSGATTLLKRTATFRVGQTRVYSKKIKKGQKTATFFVSWGVGKYRIQIVQPGGRVFSRSVGKSVRFVSGKTSSFFQVQKPKTGLWRVRVTRLKTGGVTDTATTTVSVVKRR
jgi:von Willebrand factor type A domain